jgi:tryptophan synthase alpha chain
MTTHAKRLNTTFDALKAANKKALIPFVTCGDPHPSLTVATLHALVKNGADVIELGMPFSDPVADGPVIEKASERAIAKGVDLHEVLRCVSEFRSANQHTPIVLMGYLNPILQYGRNEFFGAAVKAGADAVLIVDCPIEESLNSNRAQGGGFKEELNAAGLQQIFLVAPTSSPARRTQMAHNAEGFLYYVSFAGITGAAQLDPTQVHAAVNELKTISKAPVAVGFGVKDAASAAAIAQSADAVVIGSALVSKLSSCENEAQIESAVQEFLAPIRSALS